MNESPAFQFYPADYLADENVDTMTLMQQGAYIRLICHAWRSTTVGRLLNDPQRLSSLARMTLTEWTENAPAILRAFRIDDDGYITQKRLVKEWEKQQVRRNQAVEAGKQSAKKRSERPFNDRSTTVQRTANPSSSSSSYLNLPIDRAVESDSGEKEQSTDELESLRSSINQFFKQPSRRWTYEEEYELSVVCKGTDASGEWKEIVEHWPRNKHPRTSILTLLKNWGGELDKARNYKPDPKDKTVADHRSLRLNKLLREATSGI